MSDHKTLSAGSHRGYVANKIVFNLPFTPCSFKNIFYIVCIFTSQVVNKNKIQNKIICITILHL